MPLSIEEFFRRKFIYLDTGDANVPTGPHRLSFRFEDGDFRVINGVRSELLLIVPHSRHNFFYTGSAWTTYGEITTSRSSPRSENGTSRQSEKGELGGEPHHHTKAKCPRLPYWKHSAYDGGHPSLGSLRLAQKQHS